MGVQRQMEIYQAGLRGEQPTLPLAAEELEQKAQVVLPAKAFTYVAGGAGAEDTLRANRAAFGRWRIVPRFLRNVAQRDLSVSLFAQRFSAPLLLAPIGVQSMLHPEAELVELVWTPLEEAAHLDMPTITGIVLEELLARVEAGMAHALPVPFYFMQDQQFFRALL